MTRIYVATGDALAVIGRQDGGWRASLELVGQPTYCLAADPRRQERVYCGTFGQGLWQSEDAGASWRPVGPGIESPAVSSVAVGRDGVVWAGTEPSMLYRSEDDGRSWVARPALAELPSAPTWSFPPRPWTHHVRWIAPDPADEARIFVGIELGGVMRSLDGGLSWEDRKPGSQHDAHTLATHPDAPGRLYEAAGGGFAETRDGGQSWRGHDAGLKWRYLWGLAVDPGDPDVLVVSASPGPREAHDRRSARAAMHRRVGEGAWEQVTAGLPDEAGTRGYVLATNPAEPGVFYAAPHDARVHRSSDAGRAWQELAIHWPAGYQAPDGNALLVTG
ncbi:MAG TPA: hypothetical protein VGL23_14155 [Chloroflexota bacterium]|jgi:hypothetical protein